MVHIPLTIPNILSLYRIIVFPVIMYALFARYELLFTWLICINLVSDILDGWIARAFNMVTEIGARLDSLADNGTYIAALSGILIFKFNDVLPYLVSFYIFIGLFVFSQLLSVAKFGRMPSLHLYSWKIGGYIQGIFFFILFAFGFNQVLYLIMVIWGIIAFLEHIIIQLIISKMLTNAKGLYWLIKEKQV